MNINDILSAESIKKQLYGEASRINIICRDEVSSTNDLLKELALSGCSETAMVAKSQTAGKGRLSRSFYSPQDTGLYMSLLLKPSFSFDKIMLLTPAAAVAACSAIEQCGGASAKIKWVNDLIRNGKKICGILTESVRPSNGETCVIIGVGINLYPPTGGFPSEISHIAGYAFDDRREKLRSDLAAAFINKFVSYFDNIENLSFIEEYKNRSCVVGKRINVINAGNVRPAQALSIDDNCRLIVKYDDGSIEALYSGEISIRTI